MEFCPSLGRPTRFKLQHFFSFYLPNNPNYYFPSPKLVGIIGVGVLKPLKTFASTDDRRNSRPICNNVLHSLAWWNSNSELITSFVVFTKSLKVSSFFTNTDRTLNAEPGSFGKSWKTIWKNKNYLNLVEEDVFVSFRPFFDLARTLTFFRLLSCSFCRSRSDCVLVLHSNVYMPFLDTRSGLVPAPLRIGNSHFELAKRQWGRI